MTSKKFTVALPESTGKLKGDLDDKWVLIVSLKGAPCSGCSLEN